MKTFIGSCLLLLALIVGVFGYNKIINNACEELLTRLEGVENTVAKGNYEKIKESMGKLTESWEGAQKWFSIMIHHQQSDDVITVLARLNKRIEQKNWEEAASELAHLRAIIELIQEQERVTLVNIF